MTVSRFRTILYTVAAIVAVVGLADATYLTVQVLTGGRLVLGIGTSPWPEDYAVMGVPWEGRGARTDEMVAIIRGLLSGGYFEHHGDHFDLPAIKIAPLHRKLGNLGFTLGVRLLFGGIYSDLCYGYNAFWRRVLPRLHLDGDGFEIETIINVRALRAGLKITEVASFESPRICGDSRLRTFPDGWRVLKSILREWRADLALRDLERRVADRLQAAERLR